VQNSQRFVQKTRHHTLFVYRGEMKADIGARIRAARERRHMTLQEVAQSMGVEGRGSVSRLSNYENGIREPDAATMLRIAAALREDPAELMFGPRAARLTSSAEPSELSVDTANLVSALIRADRQGLLEGEACRALGSMLELILRLERALKQQREEQLLSRYTKSE
jgi:transcriptional regulator with XRE-family HTH domain